MNAVIFSLLTIFSGGDSSHFKKGITECSDIEWINIEHNEDNYNFLSEQTCHLCSVPRSSIKKIERDLILDKKSKAEKIFIKEARGENYLFSTLDNLNGFKSESDVFANKLTDQIGEFWVDTKIHEAKGQASRVKEMSNKITYAIDENDFVKVTIKSLVAVERIPFVPSRVVKRAVRGQISKNLEKSRDVLHDLIRSSAGA